MHYTCASSVTSSQNFEKKYDFEFSQDNKKSCTVRIFGLSRKSVCLDQNRGFQFEDPSTAKILPLITLMDESKPEFTEN